MAAGLLSIMLAAAPAPAVVADENEAIVVTGERVPRTVRGTASSVHVETESDIEARPADRVEQTLASVPNVQLGTGSTGPSIRGQDSTGALGGLPAFLGGNRPRTTLILDGRPLTYFEFVFGADPLWDVKRIEVFRSPQTTTQGQNSIAGAIFVYTNEPTFDPEYRVRATGGNLGARQLSVAASRPIAGEEVAIRLTGDLRYSRTSSDIVDRVEGADPNHDVYGLIRARMLVKPSWLDGSQLLLTYSHLQSQAPQIIGVTEPFRERRDMQGGYGVYRNNVDSLIAAARYEASEALTADLLLTTGFTKARRLATPGGGQALVRSRDRTAEAVLGWSPSGPLQITGGISHTSQNLRQVIDLSVLSGIGRFRDSQQAMGIFGEASLELLPKATITAGLRYQRDQHRRIGGLEAVDRTTIGLDYDRTFDAWLPKLSLSYDVTPGIRVGALVQRAYNPGGTTLRFDTGAPDNFDAETLWDYELFARATTPDGRLTASANLFYYDMRDAQRSRGIRIVAPNGLNVGFADLFNVPKARSYGLEAGIDWRLSERLSARVALGLLDTRIVSVSPDNAGFKGKNFQRAPRFSGSGSVDWRPTDSLRLSAHIRHRGRYFSDDLNDPFLRIGRATIADARASYAFGGLSLFGYVRNLFDAFELRQLGPASFGEAEEPRQLGVGIETRF